MCECEITPEIVSTSYHHHLYGSCLFFTVCMCGSLHRAVREKEEGVKEGRERERGVERERKRERARNERLSFRGGKLLASLHPNSLRFYCYKFSSIIAGLCIR